MSLEIHNLQLPIIVFPMSTKYVRPKKAKAAQVNHNLISWLPNYVECFNFAIHNMYFWKKNQEHVKVKAEKYLQEIDKWEEPRKTNSKQLYYFSAR